MNSYVFSVPNSPWLFWNPLETHHFHALLTMNDTASPQTAKRESVESLRQRFQQVPKKKNWNLHKDEIKHLYITQRKHLDEVMAIMKQRGFVAS